MSLRKKQSCPQSREADSLTRRRRGEPRESGGVEDKEGEEHERLSSRMNLAPLLGS